MLGWTTFATVCASSFLDAAAGAAPAGGTGIPLTLVRGAVPDEGVPDEAVPGGEVAAGTG
jgi:hypothetical protein